MEKLRGERINFGSANMFPGQLLHNIQGTHPRHMMLRNCNNNVWHLMIVKHGNDWYFTNGWREFAKDNLIKTGDIVKYAYVSKTLLDVEILTSSRGSGGVSRERVSREEVKSEEVEAEEDSENEAESEDSESTSADDEADDSVGGSGVPVQRRFRRKNIDIFGSDLFISGRIRQPNRPFFVTEMRDKRLNELYIPREIIKVRKVPLPEHMTIVDSQGRKYPTKRKRWKDGRTVYLGGWKNVCILNSAIKDDKIVCEFVPTRSEGMQLHVTFLPQDRQER